MFPSRCALLDPLEEPTPGFDDTNDDFLQARPGRYRGWRPGPASLRAPGRHGLLDSFPKAIGRRYVMLAEPEGEGVADAFLNRFSEDGHGQSPRHYGHRDHAVNPVIPDKRPGKGTYRIFRILRTNPV